MSILKVCAAWSCTLACLGLAGCGVMTSEVPKKSGPITLQEDILHVLCLASSDLKSQGLDSIDPLAVAAYKAMGIELHFDYYQEVTEQTLLRYPVVVGMIPMLHAGTQAIDDVLGGAIERYIQKGGGFLLVPGPSYYGPVDFVKQLNPWLKQFDAKLLNEQPRDPAHQQVVSRILGYRYLGTGNIQSHPATKGVDQVWLPLDASDGYLRTHTMEVGPDWTVLIRGEKNCATYPFLDLRAKRTTPGTYASEPPFLAVRDWGKGRFALFTTASRYFFFDAYHWAHGDGFVIKKGGETLMSQLLPYLAQGQSHLAKGESARLPPPPMDRPVVHQQGNVDLAPNRDDWLELVQREYMPAGTSVQGYIDCGSLSDLPYGPERGYGYVGDSSWLVRWNWSDIFHATAANSRGFDRTPLRYRFDRLMPGASYFLGVMVWGYQEEGSRSIHIQAGEHVLAGALSLPRFAEGEGPRFQVMEIPSSTISTSGTLEVAFSLDEGGTGTFSSLSEVWLFESGTEGPLSAQDIRGRFQSPSIGVQELLRKPVEYRGLIGAHSTFSGGAHSVAELSRAAKEAGLDFLVFVEPTKDLDDEALLQLKQACANASDDTFLAVPGISFLAHYENAVKRVDQPSSWGEVSGYVFQGDMELPSDKDLLHPYQLFWKYLGGQLAGGKSAPASLSTPGSNAISPFFQRFWKGFDVFTLGENGRVLEDDRELYTDVLASGYGPRPRVSGQYDTPDSIRQAAREGWFVLITASRLQDVPLFHYTSMISNGPRLKRFAFSFDYERHGENGGGILFRDPAWLIFHAAVESPTALETVTLYSGTRVLRQWYPGTNNFIIEEPLAICGNHELWLHVQAADNREAISGRYVVQNNRFQIGMCGDNQNTICNLAVLPTAFRRDDRELYLAHSYWHTGEASGQLGVMRDARELVPRIIETGIVQPVKLFHPCPVITFADGTIEDHKSSEMRMLAASEDYNQIEYRFDSPGARTHSKVLLTHFRPRAGGDTVVLVESELEALEDVELASGPQAIRSVRMALLPSMAKGWLYTTVGADRAFTTRAFDDLSEGEVDAQVLGPHGGVMLWPSDLASLLIFPMDETAYTAEYKNLTAWNGREFVGLGHSPGVLKKGDAVRSRLLVLLRQRKVESEQDVLAIRNEYTDNADRVTQLSRGVLKDSAYPLVFESERGGVQAMIDPGGGENPLPLVVRGVNSNWACGKVASGQVTLLPSEKDQVVTVLDPAIPPTTWFVGNLLTSDHADLLMEWGGVYAGGLRIHLHNPANTTRMVRVASQAGIDGVPLVDGVWTLAPGESVWLWGRGRFLVQESPSLQVLGSSLAESDVMEVTVQGRDAILYQGANLNVGVQKIVRQARATPQGNLLRIDPGRHVLEFSDENEVDYEY